MERKELKFNHSTLDGNCWYDAAADQVVLHEIAGKPEDHVELRREVCQYLRYLPQAATWVENFFSNSKKKFSRFISRHRRPGTWTDNFGIICQATALYLGKAQSRDLCQSFRHCRPQHPHRGNCQLRPAPGLHQAGGRQ